jgi:outer membrane cobalamin receptor
MGLLVLVVSLASARAFGAEVQPAELTGVVVDQSGQPLPRAHIRVLDASGAESISAFADSVGRFRIPLRTAGECRVEASLGGFQPAVVPCGAGQNLSLMLRVAPIRETVVVTATRTEAPAGQLGASVTTFTADDLERQHTPLVADLLRASPGAMVLRVGGVGNVTSLFVRGGESNYNKVLLDGIPLNEPGGAFNFSNLTTENLERIEVVRGAHSALFGSDAMASVVQLFTTRADRSPGRPRAAVLLDGGSYDTARAGASVSGAAGALDYALGATRFTTDNRVENNTFHSTTLSANVGVALGPSTTLRFVGRGELGRVGTPGATAFGRPDLDAFFEQTAGVGGVTLDQQTTPSLRQRATYALTVSTQVSTNLNLDPPYTPRFWDRSAPFQFSDFAFDSQTSLQRHHGSYQADWRAASGVARGDHVLTAVVDWDGERAVLDDRLAASRTRATRDNFGVAVQHQALWARTFVTAGVRLEHNGSYGTAAVPRASIAYAAREASGWLGDTKLKASAGQGVKEPTVLQSFSLSPWFLGNPDLAPERSRTLEAGIEQRLAHGRAKVELTWFDNRFRNQITTLTTSFNPYRSQYFNVGESRARGAELGLDVVPARAIRGRLGYTFLDSEIVQSASSDNVVFQQGQWLFHRPRHSAFAELSWDWRRFTADINGVILGRFVDSDFSSLEPPLVSNPGRATWNLSVAFRTSSQLRWIASVDNLTNADYMEPLGYPALRRAVRLGARITF